MIIFTKELRKFYFIYIFFIIMKKFSFSLFKQAVEIVVVKIQKNTDDQYNIKRKKQNIKKRPYTLVKRRPTLK